MLRNKQCNQLVTVVAFQAAFGASAVNAGVLEEVVVTAQKREQSLQDTPVSVSAFSGDQIKDLGFQDQTSVIAQSPGVTLNDFGTGPSIRIRGGGSDTFSETVESSAAVYRDEVYRPTMAGANGQLFDVKRIEVLRGPQGTLYGRNTNAGLIHYYSNLPTEELEGYGEIQLGNFGQRIVEGAISGALGTDTVRGRLSLKSNVDDGYQENLGSGGGDDFGKTDVFAWRAQLEFDLGDDATVRLMGSQTRQRNNATIYGFRGLIDPLTFTQCDAGAVRAGACEAFNADFTGTLNYPEANAEEGYSERSEMVSDIDANDLSMVLNWGITDNIELVSITAWEKIERLYQEDIDASDFSLVGFQVGADYTMDAKTLSQEFRLSGSTDRLNWVAGVFLFDDDKTGVNSVIPEFGIDALADVKTESQAVFTQLDYAVTDALTATVGIRYSRDDREAIVSTPLATLVDPSLVGLGLDSATFNIDEGSTTYKVGLQWVVSDDLMLYASHSTGLKTGEFNVNLIFLAVDAAPVGEETISSFEIGAKWTFLDGAGRLNSSIFYNDIEDYQATVYEKPDPALPAVGFFRNIGDVEVSGAEIELLLSPTTNIDFSLSLALLDSKVSSSEAIISGPFSTVYPVDGNELVQAPNVALNGLVRYNIPTDTAGTFAAQIDFNWQDDVFLDVANDPYNVQEAYGIYNVRATWESSNEKYFAQVFVENASDKYYVRESFTPEGFDRQGLIAAKPRTYGAKFGVRF